MKQVTTDDDRRHLKTFDDPGLYTYSTAPKPLKVFFRDFMKADYLVESSRFPSIECNLILVPNREELRIFYDRLETNEERAFHTSCKVLSSLRINIY